MEAKHLIKKQLAFLKEKELHEGLTNEEKQEIGRLYITDEMNELYNHIAAQEKRDYWKERCTLAENSLKEVPASTFLSAELREANGKLIEFINQNKESV